MNIAGFVIHLHRAEKRRPQADRIIEACPVSARIIDAVDGSAMDDAERAKYYTTRTLFEPAYPFRITVGEIGCFLSHRRVWQAILDENLDAGLVLEDDVEIDPAAFARAFELACRHIDAFGYIQFQVRTVAEASKTVATGNDCRLVAPAIVPLRTSAQLVSRSAAAALLAKTQTFDRPVDGLLQLYWETGIPVVCAIPPGVRDRTAETGGSTISKRRREGIIAWIRREVLRWRYRRDIAKYSRRHASMGDVR